ncbi:DDE_3 domain-containing protein [Trichonephila clavipes]|nr:DDE_3 domain-containing protein [Trichonephila clavipes]
MEYSSKTTVSLTSPGWLLAGWMSIPDFSLIKWPPRSLDLNPIEHLWDIFEQCVKDHHTAPTNITELGTALGRIRQVIPVERFQKLVETMPSRGAAIIKAKGCPR